MQLPDSVKKYLSKQNFHNWEIETTEEKSFDNIIVIPVLDEYETVKILLESLLKNSTEYLRKTLTVFVINNLPNHSEKIKRENQKLLEYLREYKNPILNIGIVDAASEGKELPVKNGGVGFARKLGLDLSLKYFDYSGLSSKKILINLDADCIVSENYLHKIVTEFNNKNLSAAVIDFEHSLPNNIKEQKAIINYEIFLRYYVLGLKYANSHFAFHTVGSTIVCDYESYIKVGGMNKRKAGEDFYFLQKLAKITDIKKIKSAIVYPSARISERVPFGTGQRVARFLSEQQNEYLVYSFNSFEVLKDWLIVFNKNLLPEEFLSKAKRINKSLHQFLIQQNFLSDWKKIISNSKSAAQLAIQKLMWMDGFRTLKLIHHLRDNEFPQENMFEALNKLFYKTGMENKIKNNNGIPPLEIQKEYLRLLRSKE